MKTKIIVTILYIGILLSLFLPYQDRFNFVSAELMPEFKYGYEIRLSLFPLILLMISVILLYLSAAYIWSLVLSLLNLFFVWLIRFEIHFQGFVDHHYDTKSGSGYYVIFFGSVLFAIVVALELILKRKKSIQVT